MKIRHLNHWQQVHSQLFRGTAPSTKDVILRKRSDRRIAKSFALIFQACEMFRLRLNPLHLYTARKNFVFDLASLYSKRDIWSPFEQSSWLSPQHDN